MRWKFNINKKWSWHKWYAWYPVSDDNGGWLWLEWVWRRAYTSWYEMFWEYNFGEKEPEFKERH